MINGFLFSVQFSILFLVEIWHQTNCKKVGCGSVLNIVPGGQPLTNPIRVNNLKLHKLSSYVNYFYKNNHLFADNVANEHNVISSNLFLKLHFCST